MIRFLTLALALSGLMFFVPQTNSFAADGNNQIVFCQKYFFGIPGFVRIVDDESQCFRREIATEIEIPAQTDVGTLEARIAVLEDAIGSLGSNTVFVTSERYQADLGGLEGADANCQRLAEDAGLSGIYLAWLADSIDDPSTRFTPSPFPYLLVDGTKVADNWNDLIDGELLNPIFLDENGTDHSRPGSDSREGVWTNTDIDATQVSPTDICMEWTVTTGGDLVRQGVLDETDADWTISAVQRGNCSDNKHLYCFEQ